MFRILKTMRERRGLAVASARRGYSPKARTARRLKAAAENGERVGEGMVRLHVWFFGGDIAVVQTWQPPGLCTSLRE